MEISPELIFDIKSIPYEYQECELRSHTEPDEPWIGDKHSAWLKAEWYMIFHCPNCGHSSVDAICNGWKNFAMSYVFACIDCLTAHSGADTRYVEFERISNA